MFLFFSFLQQKLRALPPTLRETVCRRRHPVRAGHINDCELICKFAAEKSTTSHREVEYKYCQSSLLDCHSSEAGRRGIFYLTASWEMRNEVWRALKTPQIRKQTQPNAHCAVMLFPFTVFVISAHLTLLFTPAINVIGIKSESWCRVLATHIDGFQWWITPTTVSAVESGHASSRVLGYREVINIDSWRKNTQ